MKVFFDIETLTANREAKKPSDQQPIEYAVAYLYEQKGKPVYKLVPNLIDMLEQLLKLGERQITLIAHNGNRYDNHFLRNAIIEGFNIKPKNGFLRNALDHSDESYIKNQKGNYLFEYRVKAKTSLELKFRIKNVKFVTEDSYPKFQASIATIGKLLYHHKIIQKQDEKLDYNYTLYDLEAKHSVVFLRDYAKSVFDKLDEHQRHYIFNDVNILYTAYKNYNILFPGFNIEKRTLSQNILDVYLVNPLATLQLTNNYESFKLSYTDYNFNNENLFTYIHHYYKGGLNFYNEDYLTQIVHDIDHIDLNSSYPTVMNQQKFPTFLKKASAEPTYIKFNDKRNYYFVQVTKEDFNELIRKIDSKIVREMFVKYFNNSTKYVYLQTPHLQLINSFLKRRISEIRVVSYLQYEPLLFGARDVIEHYYKDKVNAKKQGLSFGEIYTKKVILNGIYGIPALRSHFNLFEANKEGEYLNKVNGYKNTERNLVFASAVTAYALKQLLEPLTYNVKGIDKAFIYCDTDSLFLRHEYFESIKDKIKIDDFQLGAWGIEHSRIKDMYVLNHKKYALNTSPIDGRGGVGDSIEVAAGGITENTFDFNMNFSKFIETQFHDGAKLKVQKHCFTKSGVLTIYDSETEIKKGANYKQSYSPDDYIQYLTYLITAQQMELAEKEWDKEDAMYYETPVGAISTAEALKHEESLKDTEDIKNLIDYEQLFKSLIMKSNNGIS